MKIFGFRTGYISILLIIFVGFTACAKQHKKPDPISDRDRKFVLRYVFEKDSPFSVFFRQNATESQNFMGTESVVNSSVLIEYAMIPNEADGNQFAVDVEYKNAERNTDHPLVAEPADFTAIIGRHAGFKISPMGILSDFSGFDRLPEIELVDKQRSLDENEYKADVERLFPEFPEYAVGIGDTWSFTRAFEEPVPDGRVNITIDFAYTLEDIVVKDGFNCLKFLGRYSLIIEGRGVANGMDYDVKMQGAGTEIIHFVPDKGMYLDSEFSDLIEGSITNDDLGLDVPMKIESNGSISVTF